MFLSFAYEETTTYPKIIVAETSLMALMKGIELHNTKPGLKECLHVFLAASATVFSVLLGNANSALVLVTYMDGSEQTF